MREVYSDVDRIDPKKTSKIFDIDSVARSIITILEVQKYQTHFLREFGSEIESLLFELMSEENAFELKHLIIKSISRWENRVILDYAKSDVRADYDNNQYDIILAFKVKGLEEKTYQLTYILPRLFKD